MTEFTRTPRRTGRADASKSVSAPNQRVGVGHLGQQDQAEGQVLQQRVWGMIERNQNVIKRGQLGQVF